MEAGNSQSRSKSVVLNVIANTICQIASISLNLIVRRVFISTLGSEILGLNSLYNSIVGLLAVSELGLGTIVAVFLFKPLAEKDYESVNSYMHFLRTMYWIIGSFIFFIGLCIAPFVHFFINGDIENSFALYSFVLYVIAVAITYFFSYKKILLDADLHGYIVSTVQIFYRIILNLGYILILLLTNNYYLYLCVFLVCNFGENYITSLLCRKRYPWLLARHCRKLSRIQRRAIFRKMKAMMFHRIGDSLITGADNMIISKFIGTVVVAYYANYNLITSMLFALVGVFGNSMLAAFGNLINSDGSEVKKVFSRVLLLQHYLYSTTLTGFIVVGSLFVTILFGSESVLGTHIIVLMGVSFYLRGFSTSLESVRGAYGSYEKDQYLRLIFAVMNIVISVVGVIYLGLVGVLIGTVIAYGLEYIVVLPPIVFKDSMKERTEWYYFQFFKYALLTAAEVSISFFVCYLFSLNHPIVDFLVKGLLCVLIPIVFNFVLFCRTEEQLELLQMGKRIIKKI